MDMIKAVNWWKFIENRKFLEIRGNFSYMGHEKLTLFNLVIHEIKIINRT